MVSKTSKTHGYLLIIAATTLWGTMGVLAKLSFTYGIVPETLIALRLAISFATLFIFLTLLKRSSFRIQKTDILLLVILGIFATALQRFSYFYSVNLTTATVAAILFHTYPVFVTLSASFFLREKISLETLAAIILTFLGAALVVRVYDFSSLTLSGIGVAFGLLSSLLFVLYFMITKKLRGKYASWTLTVYGDGIGALVLTPVVWFSLPAVVEFPPQLWLLVLTIAWVPSLLAYLLYSHALRYVDASKGSILSVIEPLSAALFSTTFIGENLEMPQIIGVALALCGVVLLFRMDKNRFR